MPQPLISIIIPAYNESSRIGNTLSAITQYFAGKNYSYEIIVVDDGSGIEYAAQLKKYTEGIPHSRMISLPHRGKGFAVKNAMLGARGDYRVFADADNSVDISYIDSFMDAIKGGYDIAIASVLIAGASKTGFDPWYRKLLGATSRTLVRCVIGSEVKDTQRGFKMFTAKAAQEIFSKQTIDGFGFDIELIAIAQAHRLRVIEIPVQWNNSQESKVNLASYWSTLGELIKIWLNKVGGYYSNI